MRVDLGGLLASSELALNGLGLGGSLGGLSSLGTTALSNGLAVVGLVPLTERSGIDLNDGGLGQGVGTCMADSVRSLYVEISEYRFREYVRTSSLLEGW